MRNSTDRRRRTTVPAWEEAGRHDGRGLGLQGVPAQVCPDRLGAGVDAGVLQDRPYRGGRKLVAQGGQLAVDAPVSPSWAHRGARPSTSARRAWLSGAAPERGAGRPAPARRGPACQRSRVGGEMIRRSWREPPGGQQPGQRGQDRPAGHHSRAARPAAEARHAARDQPVSAHTPPSG